MTRFVLKILAIFIIGMVGGIFADQILWPYFIERPLFYQYRLEQNPVYLTERKEVTVQENVALKNALEKVEKTVVGVKAKTPAGQVLVGSGLAVTSDGLIVTLAELVPRGSSFYFYVDKKWPAYQILKRDLKNNLALVKVEEDGLSTAGFANLEKIKLGERVFLIGMEFGTTTPRRIVNEGIVSFLSKDDIQTSIFEIPSVSGSPLFDIKGNVVGLNVLDQDGRVSAIPISQIRQFIGF